MTLPRGAPHFTFIILSYNASPEETERVIRSCCEQDYTGPYDVMWVDDHSPTLDSFKTAASLRAEYGEKLLVGREPRRTYGMETLKDNIELAEENHPGCVIVLVGGDDYVSRELLGYHAPHYFQGAWAVYHQSWDGPEGCSTPESGGWLGRACALPVAVPVRQAPFVTLFGSFKASLFLKIRDEDLQIHGRWVDVSADTHMWFPMLEMAAERVVFEPAMLYRYHCAAGSGEKRTGEYYALQSFMHWRSRHMQPYLRLKNLKSEAELDPTPDPVNHTLIAVNPSQLYETSDSLGIKLKALESATDSQ